MLSKFITKKKNAWEDFLDECVFAYNTAVHESSKYTPFELMFGRKAVIPIDLESPAQDDGDLFIRSTEQHKGNKQCLTHPSHTSNLP